MTLRTESLNTANFLTGNDRKLARAINRLASRVVQLEADQGMPLPKDIRVVEVQEHSRGKGKTKMLAKLHEVKNLDNKLRAKTEKSNVEDEGMQKGFKLVYDDFNRSLARVTKAIEGWDQAKTDCFLTQRGNTKLPKFEDLEDKKTYSHRISSIELLKTKFDQILKKNNTDLVVEDEVSRAVLNKRVGLILEQINQIKELGDFGIDESNKYISASPYGNKTCEDKEYELEVHLDKLNQQLNYKGKNLSLQLVPEIYNRLYVTKPEDIDFVFPLIYSVMKYDLANDSNKEVKDAPNSYSKSFMSFKKISNDLKTALAASIAGESKPLEIDESKLDLNAPELDPEEISQDLYRRQSIAFFVSKFKDMISDNDLPVVGDIPDKVIPEMSKKVLAILKKLVSEYMVDNNSPEESHSKLSDIKLMYEGKNIVLPLIPKIYNYLYSQEVENIEDYFAILMSAVQLGATKSKNKED